MATTITRLRLIPSPRFAFADFTEVRKKSIQRPTVFSPALRFYQRRCRFKEKRLSATSQETLVFPLPGYHLLLKKRGVHDLQTLLSSAGRHCRPLGDIIVR